MINYIDVGKGKETLILISGLGQRYDKSWIPQYNLAMHYRLIIPSLRGHYESGINTDITLENMALDIVELMEYLHIKEAHICGLSLGGIVAQELYRVYPEKVKSLILCNTTFFIPNLIADKIIEKSNKVLIEEGKDGLIKRIVRKDIYNSQFSEEAKESFYISDVYLECSKVAVGYNFFPVLLRCKVPVLLIGSLHDSTTPIFNTYIMKWAISNCKMKILNAAHLSNFDCREEFNAAIRKFIN